MFFPAIFPTFYPRYKITYSSHDPLRLNSFDNYSTVYEWLEILMRNTRTAGLELGGREREYEISSTKIGLELMVYAYTYYGHIILYFDI